MKKNNLKPSLISCCLLMPSMASADIDNKIDWSARARYTEFSENEQAKAATLLLRGTLSTQWNDSFNSGLQIDYVKSAFNDDHSDGVHFNGKPIIPDPAGTDINQAFLAYTGENYLIKLGRQRINFDDQRFVGGNGFWQNEQTFDAGLTKYKFLTNSTFTYSYVFNVKRIYGDNADTYLRPSDTNYRYLDSERPAAFLGEHHHHTHLARMEWNEWDYSQWVTYFYAIDNRTMPSASNNTLGTSYTFNYKADTVSYRALAESAFQQHTETDNSPTIPYYLVDANLGINSVEFNLRYEVLASKEGVTFITPLASLHDFQGLANQIGNFSNNGLKDSSAGIVWRASPFKIESHYHQFSAYTNKQHLADELDFIFSYKPSRKHAVTLLLTNFMPEHTLAPKNTHKVYLDYAYNF